MQVDKAIAGTLPGLFRAHLLLMPGADDIASVISISTAAFRGLFWRHNSLR